MHWTINKTKHATAVASKCSFNDFINMDILIIGHFHLWSMELPEVGILLKLY